MVVVDDTQARHQYTPGSHAEINTMQEHALTPRSRTRAPRARGPTRPLIAIPSVHFKPAVGAHNVCGILRARKEFFTEGRGTWTVRGNEHGRPCGKMPRHTGQPPWLPVLHIYTSKAGSPRAMRFVNSPWTARRLHGRRQASTPNAMRFRDRAFHTRNRPHHRPRTKITSCSRPRSWAGCFQELCGRDGRPTHQLPEAGSRRLASVGVCCTDTHK